MEIKTTLISTDIIRPSSPTPKSLQKHNLSFLDQISPPFFMPFVYFYESNTEFPNSQKANHLKISLSQVLTKFYPLAGRIVGNLYVDCNDGGAPFFEAEANCNISQATTQPNPNDLHKFLPYKLNESQDYCMAVQATYFRCGGVAVGLLISHKIGDAFSFISFAKAWSAVARNGDGGGGPPPKFDAATYFPPRDIAGYKPSTGMLKEEIATKIFTFSAEKIAILRKKYACGDYVPTRAEALSAFIWTRIISATGTKADPNKVYTVQHAVNLRTRTDPPLSEYHFGNLSRLAITQPGVGQGGLMDGGAKIMQRVREAIKAVDGAYVADLKEGEKHLSLINEKMGQLSKGDLVSFTFTSLCRFPLYDADFGWEKPVWVGLAGFAYKNLVRFLDTRNGDGVEASIHLRREDMEKFEADLELQEFLSHDKSCLISKL